MSLPLKEVIKIAENQLRNAGVTDAATDAKDLMAFMLCTNRTGLLMRWTDDLQDNQLDAYFSLVERRASRIPAQHILGTQEFMGLTFKVNENVLIPRQDTETMVEDALELMEKGTLRGEAYDTCLKGSINLLDLCTGSGAIAVSLAKLCPKARVTASDISREALETAEKNAEANGVKVRFVESDMFAALEKKKERKSFDFIITNPPYIATAEISALEPEVKDHEPLAALDGGTDGLDFYRIIAAEAPDYLKAGGVLMAEIGWDQGEAVKALLEGTEAFTQICCLKDLAGKDRIVTAVKKSGKKK